jgi:hypothetical protein
MGQHIHTAIAELHAARLSMQGAFYALDRARQAGEQIADGNLRIIDAEFRGTIEEAALFLALLDAALPSAVHPAELAPAPLR